MAVLSEWSLEITKSKVEGMLSASFRDVFGNVSLGFAVAEDN